MKTLKFAVPFLKAAHSFSSSILVMTGVVFFSPSIQAVEIADIADTYVGLAEAVYSDSLSTASELNDEINKLLASPTESNLNNAKDAWRKARAVYSQSEVFRFGNPIVDDWEPQVNAWPLDEGFIDYVDNSNYFYELGNPVGQANIIASETLRWGPNELDMSTLTTELLSSLNELGGTEANVATGWHAIEFLLWGQDLNGSNPGAGERPVSDLISGEGCTNGNCDRRREYLSVVTDLLIADLEFIVLEWNADNADSYANEFLAFSADEQKRRILYSMGSLALGELAGERMKVALYANSTEDEHDCFSDDTHSTLFNDAKGIDNVLRGTYVSSKGESFSSDSLLDWAKANSNALATGLDNSSETVLSNLNLIVSSAESGVAFDQLISPGNQQGATLINNSIESLKVLTRNIELLAEAMKVETLNPDNAGHSFN